MQVWKAGAGVQRRQNLERNPTLITTTLTTRLRKPILKEPVKTLLVGIKLNSLKERPNNTLLSTSHTSPRIATPAGFSDQQHSQVTCAKLVQVTGRDYLKHRPLHAPHRGLTATSRANRPRRKTARPSQKTHRNLSRAPLLRNVPASIRSMVADFKFLKYRPSNLQALAFRGLLPDKPRNTTTALKTKAPTPKPPKRETLTPRS